MNFFQRFHKWKHSIFLGLNCFFTLIIATIVILKIGPHKFDWGKFYPKKVIQIKGCCDHCPAPFSYIVIDQNVYNGSRKINEQDKNFMTRENIRNAISTLKLKNSEGFDRIPQRILIDGMQLLIEPFTVLFNQIYSSNIIPEQWSMSKITPF